MENQTRLNVEQICSTKTYLKTKHLRLRYREASTQFFGLIKKKAGFYSTSSYDDRCYTLEEFEGSTKYYVEDNVIYYKPHLEISMSNGKYFEKYFETQDDLKEFVDENYNHLKLIDV